MSDPIFDGNTLTRNISQKLEFGIKYAQRQLRIEEIDQFEYNQIYQKLLERTDDEFSDI